MSFLPFDIVMADGNTCINSEEIIERIIADLPFTQSEVKEYTEN